MTAEEIPHVDALNLYQELSAIRTADDVYLFESLDGPDRDRHFAAVGCGRLAELRVHADRVELLAAGELGEALAAAVSAAAG
ncbi:anthranilate synthase component I family protein, partial [Streptomyces sp. NPDC004976]